MFNERFAITSTSKILKTFCLGNFVEALNRDIVPWLALVEHTTNDVWGKDVRVFIPTEDGGGQIEIRATLKTLCVEVEVDQIALELPFAQAIRRITEAFNYAEAKTDIEVRQHLYGGGSNGLTGIKQLLTYHGGCSSLTPCRKDKVGVLTENMLLEQIEQIKKRGGTKPNIIICSYKTYMRYFESGGLSAKYHLQNYGDTYGIIEIGELAVPLVADKYCPDGVMYLLNTDDFALEQLCDWRWLDDDGAILRASLTKPNTYKATLVKYAELICRRPFAQGVLTGIKEK